MIKDFIESLSKPSIDAQTGLGDGLQCYDIIDLLTLIAFEPKPLIRTFDAALQHLKSVKEQITGDIDKSSHNIKSLEISHTKKVKELKNSFQVISSAVEGKTS